MRRFLTCLMFIVSAFIASSCTFAADITPVNQALPATPVTDAYPPRVRIVTNLGDMIFELDNVKAPKTVANFLSYVQEKAYDETLFHRVIKDFIIQGGAYNVNYEPHAIHDTIETEATNGLKNERGTIAMARDLDPNSAANQFFINVDNNKILNHHAPKEGYWGYTVFGKITEGLDVLDRLQATPTSAAGPFLKDVPVTQLVIKTIIVEPPAPKTVVAEKVPPKPVVKKSTVAKKTIAKKHVTSTATPKPK